MEHAVPALGLGTGRVWSTWGYSASSELFQASSTGLELLGHVQICP